MARTYKTRSDAAATVAKSLCTFGYPDASTEKVKDILDAWIAGKRESELPHGILGRFAGRQFDEVEDANRGFLASLVDK